MKAVIHEIEQNTDEWMQLRMGRVTASNFATVMANEGKAFGKPALDYAIKVAIESKTQRNIEGFTNEWMERGKQLEEDARRLYESMTFTKVLPGGIAVTDRYGASSDGLVDPDGIVEIKCVKYNTHFKRLLQGGYDTAYQWQIRGQMWLYDVDWCDFVSYCPDYPEDKQLYVYRVKRSLTEEATMITRLEKFTHQVDEFVKVLNK
jgi:putative phage-type endonuclease